MAQKMTASQQENYFTQGLALGVLSPDVDRIPADKFAFELAPSSAMRRCLTLRSTFPTILSERRGDPYYLLTKSERRQGPSCQRGARGLTDWHRTSGAAGGT